MTNLKKILKQKKIKNKELAARCKISPAIVSAHAVKGIKTTRVAKRYAKALGCSPLDLMDI